MLLLIALAFFVRAATSDIRAKRFLIFPRAGPTRTQFVAGVGIPYEIEEESVTTGYVLRGQYFLPYKSSQLIPMFLKNQTFDADLLEQGILNVAKRSIDASSKPGTEEKYISEVTVVEEGSLENSFPEWSLEENEKPSSKNPDSRWTLYQIIVGLLSHKGFEGKSCLLRSICEAVQVEFGHHSGIIGELLHVILSPSTSEDAIERHSDNEYHFAEKVGRRGDECELLFRDCPVSILDLFSGVDDYWSRN